MGVHLLLHRAQCGHRQRLAIPGACLQERGRLLPHPLLRHPRADREAHVLPGARPRTVLTGKDRKTRPTVLHCQAPLRGCP